MKQKIATISALLVLASALLIGADVDPNDEFRMMLAWHRPAVHPHPLLEGMDAKTLSALLDSGNLMWYEPRPEPDRWEVVVGVKVHAPPQVVWAVATDYELQCKIMPESFAECKTLSRQGPLVKNDYKMVTSVFMYSFSMKVVDQVTEEPPSRLRVKTVDGAVKGREIELLLVPVDEGRATLIFLRCYPELASIGASMKLALEALPMAEPATGVGACNYQARAYKNEAERRAGYTPLAEPTPLNLSGLDLATLRLIDDGNGGLIRETPQGKLIDSLTYTYIDAPPERVWAILTNFDNYPKVFAAPCVVEARDQNQVTVNQKTASFSVMGLKFGYELHARYTLDPPAHLSYVAIDGVYEGSHGDYKILPLEGGTKSILFGSGGVNLKNDNGIVARISKSGAFPLEIMIDMMLAQSTLARVRLEAERGNPNAKPKP